MAHVNDHLATLTATMSPAKKAETLELARKLGLPADDYVWLFLVAGGYYKDYYERIPAQIEAAANAAVVGARERVNVAVVDATARAVDGLTAATVKEVSRLASKTASAALLKTIAVCCISLLFLVSATSYGGYLAGYYKARLEASSFLGSAEGALALRWYASGTLGHMARCDMRESWRIRTIDSLTSSEKGCIPFSDESGKNGGWVVN